MYSFQTYTCFSFVLFVYLILFLILSYLSSIFQLMKIAPVKKIVIIAMCRFSYEPTVLKKFFLPVRYLPSHFLVTRCHHEQVLGEICYSLFKISSVFKRLNSEDSLYILLRIYSADYYFLDVFFDIIQNYKIRSHLIFNIFIAYSYIQIIYILSALFASGLLLLCYFIIISIKMSSSRYSESGSDFRMSSEIDDAYLHKNIQPVNIDKGAIFGDPSEQQLQPHNLVFLDSHQHSQNFQEVSSLKSKQLELNRNKEREQEQEEEEEEQMDEDISSQSNFAQKESNSDQQNQQPVIYSKQQQSSYSKVIEPYYLQPLQNQQQVQPSQNKQQDIYEAHEERGKKLKIQMNAQLREMLTVVQDRMAAINMYLSQVIKHKEEELKVLHQFKQQTSRKLQENLRILMKDKMSQINRENVRELKDIKNLCINTIDRMFKIQTNIASFTIEVQKMKDNINQQLLKYESNLNLIEHSFIKVNEDNYNTQVSLLQLRKMIQPINLIQPKLDLLEKKLDRLDAIEKSMINLKQSTMFRNGQKQQQLLLEVGNRKITPEDMINKMSQIEAKLQGLQKLDMVISILREIKASNSQNI